MDATTPPQTRWFHLTPGRFVLALLAVEVLLWLSERIGWPGWHKGYAVLTGVASVGVVMLLMLVWFGVALVFRWRFQFSIRSLLVMTVAVALSFSWLAVERRQAKLQEETANALLQTGGEVWYDYELDSSDARKLGPQQLPSPVWLRNLLGVNFLADVAGATVFAEPHATDDGLERVVRGLPKIRCLYLASNEVTSRGLACLEDLPQLKYLVLDGTTVTDAGMRHITKLSLLRNVSLTGTAITDAGLEDIKRLRQLEYLHLDNTRITDAGLAHLEALSKLQGLVVDRTGITDLGLLHLRALPGLTRLKLQGTKVSDAGARLLGQQGVGGGDGGLLQQDLRHKYLHSR